MKFHKFISFIKNIYKKESIPLHEPVFLGNEKKYLNDCIDSTFVSSAGNNVTKFENEIANFTGSKYAIATNSGTSALHISLILAGVEKGDEVIVQPLTFIAPCNAIRYIGAHPIFIDVSKKTLGLCPEKLDLFLKNNTKIINGKCVNKITGKTIKAIVTVHTFGFPAEIYSIIKVASKYCINVVEDSAESLGSFYQQKHTGIFGLFGTLSFNGNKTITTGGGGMILTNDESLAIKAKHLTTTAKISHPFEYNHDKVGYNYRMANLNAALGLAQLENLALILKEKRNLHHRYKEFFENENLANLIIEPKNSTSNFWLNTIAFKTKSAKNEFLIETNKKGIFTRPVWGLMSNQKMFNNFQKGNLENSEYLENKLVNIPSGVSYLKK